MPEKLHTVKEAAAILHVHPNTVRHLVNTGQLRAMKFGKHTSPWKIRESDITLFLATHVHR